MSATIDKESFCENTGFNPGMVEIVDTQVSPFPIENRKVEFTDVKKLSYNSTQDDDRWYDCCWKISINNNIRSKNKSFFLTNFVKISKIK